MGLWPAVAAGAMIGIHKPKIIVRPIQYIFCVISIPYSVLVGDAVGGLMLLGVLFAMLCYYTPKKERSRNYWRTSERA